MSALLEARGVCKSFGALRVLDDVQLSVDKGAIAGVIGPNGAGKTTLFALLSGFLSCDAGEIEFDGSRIDGRPPHRIAQRGLVRTFQLARGLNEMTVRENLLLSCPGQRGRSLFDLLLRPRAVRAAELTDLEAVDRVLDQLELYSHRDAPSGSLSGGQRKLLELGRALMARPKLLLLDEPTAGVHPRLIGRIGDHIQRMRDELGVTVVVVEHNMRFVETFCEEITVLAEGRVLMRGSFADVRANPMVLDAYLGRGAVEAASEGQP